MSIDELRKHTHITHPEMFANMRAFPSAPDLETGNGSHEREEIPLQENEQAVPLVGEPEHRPDRRNTQHAVGDVLEAFARLLRTHPV
jgi:hypothetical protein